jgi:hypothetical protein
VAGPQHGTTRRLRRRCLLWRGVSTQLCVLQSSAGRTLASSRLTMGACAASDAWAAFEILPCVRPLCAMCRVCCLKLAVCTRLDLRPRPGLVRTVFCTSVVSQYVRPSGT